jgi:predicted hotdog family 3-hydroxylacyl-ACP dehydratase
MITDSGCNTVSDWHLEDLILHRSPMLMLTRVVEVGDKHLIAEVDISSEQLFCNPTGGVPAWVGIEYMAQAVAALSGTWCQRDGELIRLGLLIGCRRYTSKVAVFETGSTLRVSVRQFVALDDKLGAFKCEILDDGIIASGQLTVYGGS